MAADPNASDRLESQPPMTKGDHPLDVPRESTPPTPPGDPRTFWSAAGDLEALKPPVRGESVPTLERLGPSPFPRSGFPLIGFLATVYDHVAAFARGREVKHGKRKMENGGQAEHKP
jgi:hypothetical protein